MRLSEIARRVEELEIEAEKVNSLQMALFDAIFNGNSEAHSYEWAFVVLGDLTFNQQESLKKITKELFDLLKEGKEYLANP